MHRQVIEARESSFFYCELQVRSALLLAETKKILSIFQMPKKRCRRHCRAGLPRSSTIPNQTPRGWLGKVGKVLQYLDKPAPNQTCWKRVRVVKGVSSRGPADLALSTIRPTLLEMH